MVSRKCELMMSKRWDQEKPQKQVLVMITNKYELVSILLNYLICYAKINTPLLKLNRK
jgi:hypothetical protein